MRCNHPPGCVKYIIVQTHRLAHSRNTPMDPIFDYQLLQTRRQFFGQTGLRLGGLALGMLMGERMAKLQQPARVHPRCRACRIFRRKAKSLIYLHMNGGPRRSTCGTTSRSCSAYFNQDLPDSVRRGQRHHHHDQRPGAISGRPLEVQIHPARQLRHLGQRTAAVHGRRSSMTSPLSTPCTPTPSITIRPAPS